MSKYDKILDELTLENMGYNEALANQLKMKLIGIIGTTECLGPDSREEAGACRYRRDGCCVCVERLDYCILGQIAEHLISNGVTIKEKTDG